MTAELSKTDLEYEFLEAVDGREVDLYDTSLIHPSFFDTTELLTGNAGAVLSHLNACKKMIDDGLEAVLVLEDDVFLPSDIGSLADAVSARLSGAEVALLSYSVYGTCELSREGSVLLPGGQRLALPIDISLVVSGAAYIITREAAERMAKFVLPVRMNADSWANFYREGVLDRVRCVVPLPVLKNHKLESTLGSYSLGTGIRARLVWPLVRAKLPILHQYLSYRRHRIYRRWSQAALVDVPFVEKPSRVEG